MESALREVYKLNEENHEVSMARGQLEETFALYALKDYTDSRAPGGKRKKGDRVSGPMTYTQAISKAKQLNVGSSVGGSKDVEVRPLKEEVELDESFTFKQSQSNDEVHKVFYKGKEIGNIFHIHLFGTKPGEKHWAADVLGKATKMGHVSKMDAAKELLKLKSEELEEGFTSNLIAKAKEIAKKLSGNMTKAYDEIEKLSKGLSKDPEVQKALQMANEEIARPNPANPNPNKDLDEGRMKDIYTMQQDGKSSEEIAKYLKMPIKTVKSILGEEMGEVSEENLDEFTSDMIKRLKKSYSTMPQKLSTDQANALSRHLDRLDLTSLKQLAKEKIPFISTLAKNKIYKKTGKFEQLEEQDDVIKPEGESDIEGLKKQLVTAQGQISVLKQKLENEKNKAIKPTPNPETGEVPLTIGIANKLLKDKEKKEAEEKKQKEASKQIQSMAKGGEETKLEFFTKKYLSHLNESEASDKAKALGLTYMSFGRYGKDGQVTHKSVGGSLKALSKKDQETEKDTDKPSKPKTKTTGSIKNPDGSNTTSGSIKKEILKKIEDEDLTDPDMLHQFDDELSNLADDLRQTGDRETADKILDALDSVADGDISSDAPSKIEDMINALKGKPDFNTQYQKELGKMTNLYKDAKYSKQNIKDFIKDTDSIINKMSQVVEVGSQDSADYGMTVRSDAVTELAYTCTEIQDKLDEMDIDKDTKDSIYDELDTIASKNDEDNADEKEIVMAIERLKYEFKKLNKKKLKKESFNEERRLYVESIAAVKNKAEKTGMPYNILKQVYDRGMAAWKGGHRPGATQVQWALARVNSFVTKSSGTWGGADKDLAKQVKG
jgi:hypothetical protein